MRDIDHITKFLKTGNVCKTCELSPAEQNELVETAQKYYIEGESTLCFVVPLPRGGSYSRKHLLAGLRKNCWTDFHKI